MANGDGADKIWTAIDKLRDAIDKIRDDIIPQKDLRQRLHELGDGIQELNGKVELMRIEQAKMETKLKLVGAVAFVLPPAIILLIELIKRF